MPLKEPSWWYGEDAAWQARVLMPLGKIYGAAAARRLANAVPYRSKRPVICVGNFTAGGTGKTPTVQKLAGIVRDLGYEPVILSRGYGGKIAGPMRVDVERHTARDVGDEPLLLARTAMTVIARDRPRGAALIETIGPANAVILMDDGLQSPHLTKDLSFAIVDAARGFGNGGVIPAGPLRAPLEVQARLADALIITGEALPETARTLAARLPGFQGPILHARIAPITASMDLSGKRLVAYAGIANPERFFTLVRSLGAIITEFVSFTDHHVFTATDAARLLAAADQYGAGLITTEKDAVRLSAAGLAELQRRSHVLKIEMTFADCGDAHVRELIAARIGQKTGGGS